MGSAGTQADRMGVFLPYPQQHRVGSVETTHLAAQFRLLSPPIFLALPSPPATTFSSASLRAPPSSTFQSLDLGEHRGWDSMSPTGLSLGCPLLSQVWGFGTHSCEGMRDLSSLTRDQTRLLAVKAQSPNHWATLIILFTFYF